MAREEEIDFEIGESTDKKEWTLLVRCASGLTEADFAAACVSFGEDILSGDISLGDLLPIDKMINRDEH